MTGRYAPTPTELRREGTAKLAQWSISYARGKIAMTADTQMLRIGVFKS